MACYKTRPVVRYGEWVEVYEKETETLLVSFKVLGDMCQEMFDRQLRLRYDVTVPYRLKIRKPKR